jgi:hypothetical protein
MKQIGVFRPGIKENSNNVLTIFFTPAFLVLRIVDLSLKFLLRTRLNITKWSEPIICCSVQFAGTESVHDKVNYCGHDGIVIINNGKTFSSRKIAKPPDLLLTQRWNSTMIVESFLLDLAPIPSLVGRSAGRTID